MDHDTFVAAFIANWLAALSAQWFMADGNRFGRGSHLRDVAARSSEIAREAEAAWIIYRECGRIRDHPEAAG
jgi:hypothetical protein